MSDAEDEREGLWARPRQDSHAGWARPEAPGGFTQHDESVGVPAPLPAEARPWAPAPGPARPVPAHGGAVLARFEPLDGRARLARIALWIVFGVAFVVIASDLAELSLLGRVVDGEVVSSADADANDTRQQLVALVQTATYLFAAVTFIRWFNLAYRGLDALGAKRRFHTGWSIGGWFVPILGLWRPKEIANDLWDAGSPGPGGDESAAVLGWWWAVFILSEILGNVVGRAAFGPGESATDYMALDRIDIAASVSDLVGVVLAVVVVSRITVRLHRRAGVSPQ